MNRGELYVRLAPWLYTAVLFLLWEAAVHVFAIPTFFLPPPSAIAGAFVEFWGPIYRNSLFTLSTTPIGFGMAVGIGFLPAVLTAFSISFFPIVVNVATGLATIEPELEDVLKALGASKLDIMRKVGIPRTLPYFFGSLKIAITLAFVGSVISESIASNYGIGHLMQQAP